MSGIIHKFIFSKESFSYIFSKEIFSYISKNGTLHFLSPSPPSLKNLNKMDLLEDLRMPFLNFNFVLIHIIYGILVLIKN